nr:MAG TPA: hypothetical protein [Caudoviricetes sp.]
MRLLHRLRQNKSKEKSKDKRIKKRGYKKAPGC